MCLRSHTYSDIILYMPIYTLPADTLLFTYLDLFLQITIKGCYNFFYQMMLVDLTNAYVL